MPETISPPLTNKDFSSDQEVRWCPGCGDYAILRAMQKALPELGKKREDLEATILVHFYNYFSFFPFYGYLFTHFSIHFFFH